MKTFCEFKLGFFDRQLVTDPLDRAKNRIFSKLGAFTRRRAKTSLRYGKGTSRPGQPPVVHRAIGFTRVKKSKGKEVRQSLSPLRELIFFAWDDQKKSVVIGPVLGGRATGAPEVLEYGGSTTVQRGGRTFNVRVGARPTMGPALEAEKDQAVKDFQDALIS